LFEDCTQIDAGIVAFRRVVFGDTHNFSGLRIVIGCQGQAP
jgi:hypothetical protein